MSLNGLIGILRLFCPALVLPRQLLAQICPFAGAGRQREKQQIWQLLAVNSCNVFIWPSFNARPLFARITACNHLTIASNYLYSPLLHLIAKT